MRSFEYIAVCEKRLNPIVGRQRRRAALVKQADDPHMMKFTKSTRCCRQRVSCTLRRSRRAVKALQAFFDNQARVKYVVPAGCPWRSGVPTLTGSVAVLGRYHAVVVPVLVVHGCLLVLTATTVAASAKLLLPVRCASAAARERNRSTLTCRYAVGWRCGGMQVFVFGLSLEIGLRLYAEGPSDFWTFYRLSHNEGTVQGSYRAEALRFDVVVTLTAMLGYTLFKAVGVVRLCCCGVVVPRKYVYT